MKKPRFSNAIGNLDDDLVEAAAECKRKEKPNFWLKWGSVAACFAVVAVAVTFILPSLSDVGKVPGGEKTPNANEGRYKEFLVTEDTLAIMWPWDYLSESERYYELMLDGVKFTKNGGRTISEEFVGEKIGTYSIVGYDHVTEERHTVDADVYLIDNVNRDEFVAVKLSDKFYSYKKEEYNPPNTLGELFENVDLSKLTSLERFSEDDGGAECKYYKLTNDDYIWDVLSDCDEATFIEEDGLNWSKYDRNYISFTVTANALGVYKHVLTITEDGYLDTNVFNWGYLFYIGEDAANKIIEYAREHSEEAEFELYEQSIFGKVTSITDEYVLIDDSSLCNDPSEGIVYKVPLNDIRISRYFETSHIKEGEYVKVVYEGEIDAQTNTITFAQTIADVNITFDSGKEDETPELGSEETVTHTTSSKAANFQIPE